MVIALLTDFDGCDGLGVVKGVIYRHCSDAKIVDLYNDVAPYQVRSGAWILLQDYRHFPKNTVFFAVVDPGVGGRRRAIAVKTKNYFFVGPDNGLIFPAASEDGIKTVVELPIAANAAKTFHGRDIFAPAAAKLEKGVEITDLGNEINPSLLQQLKFHLQDRTGEVVVVEHYGNVVTNLPPLPSKKKYQVSCGNFKNNLNYYETYEQAKEGELFFITGSRGTMELSVKKGSAAAVTGIKVGNRARIF